MKEKTRTDHRKIKLFAWGGTGSCMLFVFDRNLYAAVL